MSDPKKTVRRKPIRLAVLHRPLGSKPNPVNNLALANYNHRGSIYDGGS
jgi:hypothetical protein